MGDVANERDEKLRTILALADELAIPGTADAAAVLFVALYRLAGADGWHERAVRRMWFALNNGDPAQPEGLKIRLAALAVEHAVIGKWPAAWLARRLAGIDPAFKTVSEDDLADWLRRHTQGKKPGRGGLTTEGVVTELLMASKALGSSQDREKVRLRVTDLLKRANT